MIEIEIREEGSPFLCTAGENFATVEAAAAYLRAQTVREMFTDRTDGPEWAPFQQYLTQAPAGISRQGWAPDGPAQPETEGVEAGLHGPWRVRILQTWRTGNPSWTQEARIQERFAL